MTRWAEPGTLAPIITSGGHRLYPVGQIRQILQDRAPAADEVDDELLEPREVTRLFRSFHRHPALVRVRSTRPGQEGWDFPRTVRWLADQVGSFDVIARPQLPDELARTVRQVSHRPNPPAPERNSSLVPRG